jgi:hypothetical protein
MQWRPVAYVALRDESLRRAMTDALGREGWTVIATPTGYHLVESMADFLLGQNAWLRPALVIAEARSPGCSGMTLARGLRDLGWPTPVVLIVRSPDDRRFLGDIDGADVHIVDGDRAIRGVLEIARARRRHQRALGGGVARDDLAGQPVGQGLGQPLETQRQARRRAGDRLDPPPHRRRTVPERDHALDIGELVGEQL